MNTTEWLQEAIKNESFRESLVTRIKGSRTVNEAGCWIWNHRKDKWGYGVIKLAGRRVMMAHRVSFVAHGGTLSNGPCVLHSCHTPACCNPSHLKSGTQQDNENDKVQAGRQCKGSDMHGSKLTPTKVLSIRKRLEGAESLTSIATDFHVARQTISKIQKGLIWTHLH